MLLLLLIVSQISLTAFFGVWIFNNLIGVNLILVQQLYLNVIQV